MNESHKEFLRQVQELLQASERRIIASYDRIENASDNCRLAMGGTASSSSTSAWSDGCCVTEVPAPASFNPDASLVAATDVEDLATPTPTRCLMEGPSRDSSELRLASAPATAPTTPAATGDITSVLAAAAASDGTLDDEAISGVAGAAATCSTVCLPRHPVASSLLVASSPPTPIEYVLDTNILVAAVPPATAGMFSAVLAPTARTPTVQMQQLYNDSELFRPTSSQHITIKVAIHRPMPWPSFMCFHADGDEARPLPWPSFMEIDGCEFPSDAVENASQWCSFDGLRAKSCAAIEFQALDCYGNLFTSTGCIIIHVMCISGELRCLNAVRCLEYWWSTSDCVQSVYLTLVWLPCSIPQLKLFSNGPDKSLILDPIGRVHMHVSAICSVWRLLIGSVASVPFLNLAKFLGHDSFQWSIALYISYHFSLSCLHTQSTCATLWMSVMTGQLISVVVLLMLILCNSYAALVRVCFPCSVPDPSYKWLMPWSMTESEVVKWYIEPAPLLACRVYTDLNRASMSFGMLRASLPVLENRQPLAIFLTARTVMLQSKQSSWIYEMPKEDQSMLQGCNFSFDWHYFKVEQMIASFLQALISSRFTRLVSQCGFDIHQWMGWSHQLECFTIATHWSLHELVCCYKVSSCLPVAPLGLKESACYLFSEWMCEAYWKQFLTDSNSPSNANVVLLSFLRKTHPNAILMQGGTRADLSSLVSCRLWLQNHQVTMHIQMVWSPHIQTVCTSFLWMITQRTSHALLLMLCLNLLVVRLLQNWPPPIAYCSITSNMFSYPDLSNLAICEVWLLNYMDTKQMLIGRPPCVHASFITYELPTEEKLSYCFLCWYYGGLALILTFDRQELFQGGRCAMTFRICYLTHDSSNDFFNSNGFKWDPGGSGLLGSSTTTAWGQAVFQGGRGVRVPPCTSTWAGTGLVVMGLAHPPAHQRDTNMQGTATKRASRRITNRTGSVPRPHCFSDFPSLLL